MKEREVWGERERESNMHKEGGENSRRKKRKINNISLSPSPINTQQGQHRLSISSRR
jgi:hypothetical protein